MIEQITDIEQVSRTQLEQLASEFFTEAKVPGKFSYAHFRRNFEMMIAGGIAAMWVVRQDNKLVGALCGILYPDAFTGDLTAVENFWFVTAECRGRHGLSMFMDFEKWARENGASKIMVAYMHAIAPERMNEFYVRMGYRLLECMYVKETT